MSWLARLPRPPVFADEAETHQAFMLHVILCSLVAVPVIYVIQAAIFAPAFLQGALVEGLAGQAANVALLVIGCFMETTAILLIATPTLFPLIVALGIDPVHFGIILVVNLLIGTLTPPFGVILFIMMDIAKISLAQMTRAVLPLYFPLLFTLLVITYWADFVLAIPRFFGKPD